MHSLTMVAVCIQHSHSFLWDTYASITSFGGLLRPIHSADSKIYGLYFTVIH